MVQYLLGLEVKWIHRAFNAGLRQARIFHNRDLIRERWGPKADQHTSLIGSVKLLEDINRLAERYSLREALELVTKITICRMKRSKDDTGRIQHTTTKQDWAELQEMDPEDVDVLRAKPAVTTRERLE